MALLTKLFALQKLGLQGNLKSVQSFGDPSPGPGALDSYVIVVTEDEQADVYCCWAESALLKFRCSFSSESIHLSSEVAAIVDSPQLMHVRL